METAHLVLAYAAGTAAVLAAAVSAVALRRPEARRWFGRLAVVVVGLVVAAALPGSVELAAGQRPHDELHLVYGLVAIGLVPLARSFTGGQRVGRPRAEAALMTLAYAVLALVVARLFMTG